MLRMWRFQCEAYFALHAPSVTDALDAISSEAQLRQQFLRHLAETGFADAEVEDGGEQARGGKRGNGVKGLKWLKRFGF